MYYKNRCRAVSVKAKGKRCFWSNCIVEAAKVKLSDYRNVRIRIFLPFDSKDRFFHVAWYVKRDGTTYCYDFQPEFESYIGTNFHCIKATSENADFARTKRPAKCKIDILHHFLFFEVYILRNVCYILLGYLT